jgi:hypothetical protein
VERSRFFCALCLTARRTCAATLLAAGITYAGISHRRSTRKSFYSSLAQKDQTQQKKSNRDDTLHETNHMLLHHSLPICKWSRRTRKADQLRARQWEYRAWYHYYFLAERRRNGLEKNGREFCRLLWRLWSPNWPFGDETYERSAKSFDHPDFVNIKIIRISDEENCASRARNGERNFPTTTFDGQPRAIGRLTFA